MNEAEINNIVENIHNKNLLNTLKNNTKYTIEGFLIGSIIGFLIASISGKCKTCLTIWSGIAGGSGGYLISNKINK